MWTGPFERCVLLEFVYQAAQKEARKAQLHHYHQALAVAALESTNGRTGWEECCKELPVLPMWCVALFLTERKGKQACELQIKCAYLWDCNCFPFVKNWSRPISNNHFWEVQLERTMIVFLHKFNETFWNIDNKSTMVTNTIQEITSTILTKIWAFDFIKPILMKANMATVLQAIFNKKNLWYENVCK